MTRLLMMLVFSAPTWLCAATWAPVAGGTTPSGAIIFYYLPSCPPGWIHANGTAGTPDLRGEFVRGLDSGRGVDAGRGLGTAQADAFKSHQHSIYANGSATSWGRQATGSGPGDWLAQTSLTGDAETRPRNVALLPCMKQ